MNEHSWVWTRCGLPCCATRLWRLVRFFQQLYALLTALHCICCSADVQVCGPLGELSVALVCCQVRKIPECCGLHKSSGTFQRQQPHKGCLGFNKGPLRVTTGSQSLLEVRLFPGVSLSVCWYFLCSVVQGSNSGQNQTGQTGLCWWAFCTPHFKAPSFLRRDGAVHECQFFIKEIHLCENAVIAHCVEMFCERHQLAGFEFLDPGTSHVTGPVASPTSVDPVPFTAHHITGRYSCLVCICFKCHSLHCFVWRHNSFISSATTLIIWTWWTKSQNCRCGFSWRWYV